jgi:ABC-type multidrug transport system permease subunit
MYALSSWALIEFVAQGFFNSTGFVWPSTSVPWVALVLLILAAMVLYEALKIVRLPRSPSPASIAA